MFSDLLLAHGKNRGVAIDAAYFRAHIAGRANDDIFGEIWPELDLAARAAMADEKEAAFRRFGFSVPDRFRVFVQGFGFGV